METINDLGPIKTWLKFRSIHFKGLVTVISFNTVTNLLHVNIDPEEEGRTSWEEDGWNLQVTIWAFEKGEYYVDKEKNIVNKDVLHCVYCERDLEPSEITEATNEEMSVCIECKKNPLTGKVPVMV